ncbi:uncharacterized protein DUF222 [Labedaea rhizosphaerae]|uniref:Uncharacterized protein DUF222 n=2 Tax=Labedaea rhizosphaerae TaxID=598644 RepID=A0A4R6S5C0_LABRH|nr:uncharacterized protein DUF222 [Labedaea rhizosphaerae]
MLWYDWVMDLGELQSLVAERRRLDLAILDAISVVDWRESGYLHLWQFLMDALRATRREAKQLETQVSLLCPKVGITGQVIPAQLPVARAVMAEGAIATEHVTRIAKTVAAVPAEHADQVEADLAELAREFNPAQLARLGKRMVDALDPDGAKPADPTVVEAQNILDLQECEDGSLEGRFTLGAETAAVLRPLLSSLTAPQPGDDRTLVERQGDALAEVIRFAADSGQAPMEGGERPHIAVTVSLETLQTAIGKATLDDARWMTPEQARRFACDAEIIPVVLGTNSQPIDIGESKRLADKRLRRALAIRDKGCAVPGCERTPNQCQAHHVQHWADGGPTRLDNMVLVCQFHHRLIHHAGWQVHMDNGQPVFTKPPWAQTAA